MSPLRISLFGGLRVVCDGSPVDPKLTHTVQSLLVYLLLHRERSHSRETLAGVLWGDRSEERARACLSTALWRLRRALESKAALHGRYLLTMPGGNIAFNRHSDYWLDVEIFEEQAGHLVAQPLCTLAESEVRTLERGVQLYTTDMLEGFYDEWAVRERERLRGLYLDSLVRLMRYYAEHGNYTEGLARGQQILICDPLREEIHREVIRLYLANGQRAQAIQQYEHCREVLLAELGIPPMPETQELYADIVPRSGRLPSAPIVNRLSSDLQPVLRQLRTVAIQVDELRDRVQDAIHLVQSLAADTERTADGLTPECQPARFDRPARSG